MDDLTENAAFSLDLMEINVAENHLVYELTEIDTSSERSWGILARP